MDYHLLTKKCDGMCDSCECPPAEFECLGEPSLCDNPRGCGCQAPSEPHPSCKTPEGCRENGCLGWCDEYQRQRYAARKATTNPPQLENA